MSFEKHICWEPKELGDILHNDAEAIPEDLFLAIHTDNQIKVSVDDARENKISYEEFLNDFLEGSYGNNVQAVILGESGSGKSHLIQWMNLHIPRNDNTIVLTIPKTQTNLYNVLKNLIQYLPKEEQKRYSDKLQKTEAELKNDSQRINEFLSSLALTIEKDLPQGSNKEEEEFLIGLLPDLFNDPYFRKKYFNDHPVINNIISLIFRNSSINRNSENRQEFKKNNLPLNAREAMISSGPTQKTLEALLDEDLLKISLDIINRNIDKAISRTLSFSPNDLMELMSDLRKFFYRTNKELVLLIEDFAQLQGVDTALLQVLTEDGKKTELCKIKWAMAVTTGYYEKLANTVRTRITFKIYMDSSWDQGNISNQNKYILNLGSKYLNAIRLGNKKINEWFISYKEKAIPIFNACSFCDEKDICHKAFGTVDGIGLYPFNEMSLLKMARQADKEKKDVFRPRIFINNVIRRNFKTQMVQVINDGQYPPRDLYDDFNTEQLSFDEINKLTRIDPLEHFRRETLLELWSSTDKIVNLDDKIHTAFSLPALDNFNYIEQDVVLNDEFNIPPPPNENNEHIKNIEKWGRGKDLHHGTASELRRFIYAAIMDHIDWDFLPVAKTMNIFKRDHLYFKGQSTRKPTSGYILEIEQNIDLAMIFKTLYIMNKDKKLPDNISSFAQLQEQILIWSEYIIDENTKYYGSMKDWNPTNAAIELLILSSIVGSTDVSLDSLFQSNIEYPKMASSKLLSLITNTFTEKNRRDIFRDLFEKTYTGRKGGSKTSAFIDVNKVLPIIKNLKKNNWKLLQDSSKEKRKIFKEITSLYTSWKLNFEDCLTDELIERFKWLDQLDKRIEIEDIDIKFKNKIKKIREVCANNGIPGYQSKSLDDALKCNLVQAKKGLDTISKFQEQSGNVVFTELFPSRKDEIILFVKLITVYEEILDKVNSELTSRVEELNRGTGLSSINLEITTSIDKIDDNLNKIIGNSYDAC